MFGANVAGSSLTLTKVLSGISKGLSIANQVIPLYQQAKPMIQNARKVMSVLKEFNSTTHNKTEPKKTIEAAAKNKKTEHIAVQSSSSPVFFQ